MLGDIVGMMRKAKEGYTLLEMGMRSALRGATEKFGLHLVLIIIHNLCILSVDNSLDTQVLTERLNVSIAFMLWAKLFYAHINIIFYLWDYVVM